MEDPDQFKTMEPEHFKALVAAHYIDRRHVLFLGTANPIHAWSAYKVARQLDVPIPAWVLACFDQWASVLTATTHTSAKQIADGLHIGTKGGPLVTQKAAREMRDLEIVADVLHLKDRPTRAELTAMKKRDVRLPSGQVLAIRLKGDIVDPGDRNITAIMEQVAEERGLDYSSVKTIYYRMIRSAKLSK